MQGKQYETLDLILSRYSNSDYVLNLDFDEGLEMIKTAYDKQAESRLYNQWLMDYLIMDKDTFVPFEDYLNKFKKIANGNANKNRKSKDEIIARAMKIREKDLNNKMQKLPQGQERK